MSSSFKPGQYNVPVEIREDPSRGERIVKSEAGFVQQVQDFKFQDFRRSAPRPSSGGPMPHSDGRFALSGLAKEALRLEEEEQARIAQAIQDRVTAISEAAREEGHQQGYQDGLEQGREQAHAEIREEFKARLDQLESTIQAVEGAKEKMLKANERLVVDLIAQAVRMIALKELATDHEYLGRLATSLVEKVSIKENLILRISPADAASLEALRAQLVAGFPGLKNFTIEVSDLVQGGGCQLETEWGAIDASVATQVARIEQSLIESFRAAGPSK